jgi:hypothetical protein
MVKNMIKKFNKNFFDVEINGRTFSLNKIKSNLGLNSFYYYSEFEKIKKFKISNVEIDNISIGLSFFEKKENKIGICFFAKKEEKYGNFLLETVVKKNPNLKIQYFSMENLKEKTRLVLNCSCNNKYENKIILMLK